MRVSNWQLIFLTWMSYDSLYIAKSYHRLYLAVLLTEVKKDLLSWAGFDSSVLFYFMKCCPRLSCCWLQSALTTALFPSLRWFTSLFFSACYKAFARLLCLAASLLATLFHLLWDVVKSSLALPSRVRSCDLPGSLPSLQVTCCQLFVLLRMLSSGLYSLRGSRTSPSSTLSLPLCSSSSVLLSSSVTGGYGQWTADCLSLFLWTINPLIDLPLPLGPFVVTE